MIVKVKKLDENAKIPYQAKRGDFCYDVYAISEKEVAPNIWEYGIGLAFEIVRPETSFSSLFGEVFHDWRNDFSQAFNSVNKYNDDEFKLSIDFRPRSSIWKTGMILSNCEGTIDECYRGEVKAYFYHVCPNMPRYKVGDRIGQIKLGISPSIHFEEVDELNMNTERGTSGFGSTGLK